MALAFYIQPSEVAAMDADDIAEWRAHLRAYETLIRESRHDR
ncbi:MAG: hypothetical protein AAF360_00100 [Pseudomonadota bacterium]